MGKKQISMLSGGGSTPLHHAIDRKIEKVINILIDADADIFAIEEERIAFICAIVECSIDILTPMARQDACWLWLNNQASHPESYVLHHAAAVGNEEACRLLVEEFSWNVGYPEGDEPIYSAVRGGSSKVVRILAIEWHAYIDSWLALYYAYDCEDRFEDTL